MGHDPETHCRHWCRQYQQVRHNGEVTEWLMVTVC